ncbi:MAG TPA: CcmD family protein [Chitinophagaceae bacterium]|nr:CcmD family protein [Chitinophagaceae bacterium]
MNLRKLLTLLLLLPLAHPALAKDGDGVEMADLMRSNGRIYVVVAVVVLILIGLILYLVRLDRKLRRLEKGER